MNSSHTPIHSRSEALVVGGDLEKSGLKSSSVKTGSRVKQPLFPAVQTALSAGDHGDVMAHFTRAHDVFSQIAMCDEQENYKQRWRITELFVPMTLKSLLKLLGGGGGSWLRPPLMSKGGSVHTSPFQNE